MQKPIEEIPIISPVVTESVSDVKTLIKKVMKHINKISWMKQSIFIQRL